MTASLIALATQRFFATVLQSAWNKLRNGMETGTVNAFPAPCRSRFLRALFQFSYRAARRAAI